MFTETKKCTLCGSENLKNILDLNDQPPANSLRLDQKSKLKNIPLILNFCTSCNVPQLKHIVNEKLLFSNYFWVTGTSETAKKHSNFFYEETIQRINKERLNVLEIASNDGTFLEPFKKNGHEVLGIDPAKNICEIANKKGIKTINEFFDENIVVSNDNLSTRFDLTIARNVLPHVNNIHSIISGLNKSLKKNSFCVVEFHSAETILKELHYDSIYHEHLYYFSLTALIKIFKEHGLYAFDLLPSPISGGSWIVYFSNSEINKTSELLDALKNEQNLNINSLDTWVKFSKDSINHASSLNEVLDTFTGKIVGFGASARSSTLLNFCKINKNKIDFIVDKNPLKSDHFTPGSDIIIKTINYLASNIHNVSLILILAWNFKDEIIKELKEIGYKGYILVPFPRKVKLYEI